MRMSRSSSPSAASCSKAGLSPWNMLKAELAQTQAGVPKSGLPPGSCSRLYSFLLLPQITSAGPFLCLELGLVSHTIASHFQARVVPSSTKRMAEMDQRRQPQGPVPEDAAERYIS
ncbi:hypothetical protein P7K49_015573 [Saguinus oedipus]|uniref:Uncharacterized protein n=1 Tax=Saguinus oedipus TaxID=9490 RepID=A0ABQ9VAW1_SAGOE|nr:hypothetical protein P7K49_015573 [Saguinus oedipus]